jgi:hypothetical protein
MTKPYYFTLELASSPGTGEIDFVDNTLTSFIVTYPMMEMKVTLVPSEKRARRQNGRKGV